ncbi:MAG: DNA repair and recombination protein RadB [Nanoarchaeota archaeon]|nr:DNA repair and recombination protein RadB [Nanoarchaeota archaeon]
MSKNKISSGSYDLNKWLYGGYETDIITMIAGPPGSGKTNFAILAACSQAKKGNKVLFIDTEGGFSTERVKQIVEENPEEILKNILILKPTNFEEQKEAIRNLKTQIKKESLGLIIIDGMAMLYRLELGDSRGDSEEIRELNREVAKQMGDLAEIARKQEIPIMITNQVYSSFLTDEEMKKGIERETNIVGGDLFKYWSKCIIQLSNDNRKRKAFLLKHRYLPQKELPFEIRNRGVFKRGIF